MATAVQSIPFHLSKVKLENYRTIRSCEVELEPGLNIVIGKNGSGKTSFSKFLYSALQGEFDQSFGQFQTSLEFTGANFYRRNFSRSIKINEQFQKEVIDSKSAYLGNLEIADADKNLSNYFKEEGKYVTTRFIKHGLPDKIAFWSYPINHRAAVKEDKKDVFNSSLIELLSVFGSEVYLTSFNSSALILAMIRLKSSDELVAGMRKTFDEVAAAFSKILKKFSPVDAIRLSPLFEIKHDSERNEIAITHLFFEFKINDDWFAFDQLSDGTKRVLFILAELTSAVPAQPLPINISLEIVVLEEPELGVHPHQIHQLTTFFNEVSNDKQIIITTHNPQVLDILGQKDLNKIIVCKYDEDRGTILRHLTDEEKANALAFMKDDYLSDYWRFSNLEN